MIAAQTSHTASKPEYRHLATGAVTALAFANSAEITLFRTRLPRIAFDRKLAGNQLPKVHEKRIAAFA